MGASLAELQELMDALIAGDGRAARAAATRHVQRAAAAAIALLRIEQTPAVG
jgi:DNA-binding GntR family transcriptional regulator